MAKVLTKYKILTIYCACGLKLLQYKKGPGARLIKIHRDRITKDFNNGLFLDHFGAENTDILCPQCNKRLSSVKVIAGKYVNKVNQGQILSK